MSAPRLPRHYWEPHEVWALRVLYPHFSASEIADVLQLSVNCVLNKADHLGLKKPTDWIAERARHRMADPSHPGRKHQFHAGQKSWNTGTKGLMKPNTGSFKKGQLPQTWQPIGSNRTTSDGYLTRKTADTRCTRRDYAPVHHLVWRMHGGTVPAGHALVFRDGDSRNFDINNLELLTRAQLMARNSVHRHGPEIAHLTQLLGAIKRQLNATTPETDHA